MVVRRFFLLALGLASSLCVAGCRGSAASPPTCPRGHEPRWGPAAGQVEYEGRSIVFDERTDPPELTIDGTKIAVEVFVRCDGLKKYHNSMISYADYATVFDLAKALIETGAFRMMTGKSPD